MAPHSSIAISQRTETESMRRTSNVPILFLVFAYPALVLVVATGQGRQETAAPNPEARKLKNPVAATPKSTKSGEQTFQRFCASCHGKDAKGDGPTAPKDRSEEHTSELQSH